MYELVVRDSFSGAHSLRGYEGKCRYMHGHNWTVKAFFQVDELNDIGMGTDFNVLKAALKTVLDRLDHKNLDEIDSFCGVSKNNATAENISRYIYHAVKSELGDDPAKISRITVWETENCACSYWE